MMLDTPAPIYSFVRSAMLSRFPQLALQSTTKAVVVATTSEKGDEAEAAEDGYLGGEKKRDTATRARRKELRNVSRQIGRGMGKGDGTGASDSLRQLRRQINMPGRAISNIRRSRRVGASCVRARELR